MNSKVLVMDRLRNPEKDPQRLVAYQGIQAGFPAFSVAEEGENGCLHYQGLVEIDITPPCYAQKFKRKGYKGNQVYSTKQVPTDDKDRTLQYLCKGAKKGTLPVVVNNTMCLTDQQIERFHYAYWTENQEIAKSKNSKKDKTPTQRETFYKEFVEFCQKDPSVEMGKYKLDWIGKQFFRYWGKSPKPEMVNWIKGVIFSAQCALLQGEDSLLADRCIDRWVDRVLC